MAFFFPGGDILDFLACFGKAPGNVGRSAHDSKQPVFVEDTDPSLAKAATPTKGGQEKCWSGDERGPTGWDEDQPDRTGWDADQPDQTGWEAVVADKADKVDGWDACNVRPKEQTTEWGSNEIETITQHEGGLVTHGTEPAPHHNAGWGTLETEIAPMHDDGWNTNETDTATQETKRAPTDDDGWNTNETETATQPNDAWNIDENVESGWKNAQSVAKQPEIVTSENANGRGDGVWQQNDGYHGGKEQFANLTRTGTFGPSGANSVPLGSRRRQAGNQESSKKLPAKKVKISDAADANLSSKETYKERSMNGREKCRRHQIRELLANHPKVCELQNLCNKILHYSDYKNGDKLKEEDQKFVLEKVIVHHPEKDAKFGCGVEYVVIDTHPNHDATCFFLVRKDGSKADFSYWKCLEKMLQSEYPGRDCENKTPDNASQKGNSDADAWVEVSKDSMCNETEEEQLGFRRKRLVESKVFE